MSNPGSPKGSTGDSEDGSSSSIKIKTIVHSLLESASSEEHEVRQAAAHSLSLVGRQFPLLVLQEWYNEYTRRKQSPLSSPTKRRESTAMPQPYPFRLSSALHPVIAVMVKHKSLDSGEVNQRAILGQIMAALVEEMLGGVGAKEVHYNNILVDLAANYMDKVMDVLLVHYQASSSGAPISPLIVETLASLAYAHPHQVVPFLKAILSTTAHIMRATKPHDILLKTELCKAICRFSEAVLDYVANIHEMQDTSVTTAHFQAEGDAIYDILYSSWLATTKEKEVKLLILECIAACTPFLSKENILDKGAVMTTALISLYKKLGSVANLEITLCISGLIEAITGLDPNGLDNNLDLILNAIFAQACIVPDYLKPNIVKNHHETIRTFDILMKFYPEKVVSGLLSKYESSEERSRVGALTVIKHLLNLPTKTLNYRLEEITKSIHANLGESNPNVKRLMAQIILVLGHHGSLAGESGRDFVDFIVKMCAQEKKVMSNGESLAELGDNILQLLTNSVGGVESVLWPYQLEYLMQEEYTLAVPAVAKSLAVLSKKKKVGGDTEFSVAFGNLQFCSNPVGLFSRLIVLASNPQVDKRGTHILNLLRSFAPNIHKDLQELWDNRFPLLLHYLEQHDSVVSSQWHNWLLDLLTDSLTKINDEEWSKRMAVCLVDQFSMYSNSSVEKSFAIQSVGNVLELVKTDKVILDNMSSLFLASVDSGLHEEACAKAFGIIARQHLNLVMNKLEVLYKNQVTKKRSTSFFGLLRDKAAEENQSRALAIILVSLGQAAKHSPTEDLKKFAEQIMTGFLAPVVANCRESEKIQEAVLTAVSEVAIAFQNIAQLDNKFSMPQQDEILSAVVSILQDNLISLTSKQMALIAMTNLIQLPPAITQATRCSMLKASFNTLFNSFLEADCFKLEDYAAAHQLEKKLTSIADSLHILIKELLKQDMEQSTVDEIFTMLESWLRLDQPLSRELAVNILQGTLETYSKNVKLGIGSPSNFTPGPYMIGACVARCHDPSLTVRKTALVCLQYLLRILGVYEGLSPETVENSIQVLNTMNARCNNIEMSAKLDGPAISEALVAVLNERIQHHHVLTLLDSLADGLLDSQISSVSGCIAVFDGLVNVRGSEVFQNIPGLASKLHFKMTMMSVDESSDLMTKVASNVRYLATHNCRGVISSLLRADIPFDRAARLIWSSMADGSKLATDIIDILLELGYDEPVKQTVHGNFVANSTAMSSMSAITIMLDTHNLETICRQEFGRIFSHMVVIAAKFVNARFDRKGSHGNTVSLPPFVVALESLRSLFSAINCLVVSHCITTDHTIADIPTLREIMTKVTKTTVLHAPHLLQLIVSALLPLTTESNQTAVRQTCVSVLANVALEKAGGDMVLLSSVIAALLKVVTDPDPVVREIVLGGLAAIQHCTIADVENLSESTIAAYIHGIEDEKSADVSLTALKGLCGILSVLPAAYVHNSMELISLKVRPYFEMSGNEHRAAAVWLYGGLARFAEGSFRTIYLDHCQTVLGPVLLYSTSSHEETSKACMKTLESIVTAAQEPDLAEFIKKYNIQKGLEALVDKVIKSSNVVLGEMMHSLIGQCLGYFRSSSPVLRKNAVILLSKILCSVSGKVYDVNGEEEEEAGGKGTDEELINGVLGGTLDLLKDPDIEVRKTAALYIGDLVTTQSSLTKTNKPST